MGQPASVFGSDPAYLAKIASLLSSLQATIAQAKRDLDPDDYKNFRDRVQELLRK